MSELPSISSSGCNALGSRVVVTVFFCHACRVRSIESDKKLLLRLSFGSGWAMRPHSAPQMSLKGRNFLGEAVNLSKSPVAPRRKRPSILLLR
jgi:hypothetical protein